MYSTKYQHWVQQCISIIERRKKRQIIINAALVSSLSTPSIIVRKKYNKRNNGKRLRSNKILMQREYKFFNFLFPALKRETGFADYFRMSASHFEDLLSIVGPTIYQKDHIREPLCPPERLCITLRFLASGDLISSIHHHYLRDVSTLRDIIKETCQAIWECLYSLMLPGVLKPERWLSISIDFEKMWNFPHCIGAIDGKRILLQPPENYGSSIFNYKDHQSIVLLAICDANYNFLYVDINAFGRGSDSTVFKNSLLGQKFDRNEMNLPNAAPITAEGIDIPYFLVGDEAFPLTDYMLRPYPGRNLTYQGRIYNYRLNRARCTVESTFGILASTWRIFRRPIDTSIDVAEKIVKATVCLHNWIRQDDDYVNPDIVHFSDSNGERIFKPSNHVTDIMAFKDITKAGTNTSSRSAISFRNELCVYFNSEGAVPGQYDYCN